MTSVTEEVNSLFYSVLIHLALSSHIWLVSTILDSTGDSMVSVNYASGTVRVHHAGCIEKAHHTYQ